MQESKHTHHNEDYVGVQGIFIYFNVSLKIMFK
jgi:hypothetical protein